MRVLSRLFRRLFLEMLEKSYQTGKLKFFSDLKRLENPKEFAQYLHPVRQTEWVVYAKHPFGGPKQVLEYLGRYTHRIAISNQRLVSMNDGQVSFRWKDYRHQHKRKTMQLSAPEFIRRFLMHAIPPRFPRIRYYEVASSVTLTFAEGMTAPVESVTVPTIVPKPWATTEPAKHSVNAHITGMRETL